MWNYQGNVHCLISVLKSISSKQLTQSQEVLVLFLYLVICVATLLWTSTMTQFLRNGWWLQVVSTDGFNWTEITLFGAKLTVFSFFSKRKPHCPLILNKRGFLQAGEWNRLYFLQQIPHNTIMIEMFSLITLSLQARYPMPASVVIHL